MTRQMSFTKLRNEFMPLFREKMHQAESTEDVKKFYANTMYRLFDRLAEEDGPIGPEDFRLSPSSSDGYHINPSLFNQPALRNVWSESDLPYIIDDFTQMALNRHTRLSKNQEKTRAKIHHNDGKR